MFFETDKNITEIYFEPAPESLHPDAEVIAISEPIVMKSAAGWYVGALAKVVPVVEEDDFPYSPFARYTDYMNLEQAKVELQEFLEIAAAKL